MLPLPWQRYVYNPANLLAMQEERGSYEEIYGNQVPIRCSSEDGIPISGTAEDYIFDWLAQPISDGQMPDTLFCWETSAMARVFLHIRFPAVLSSDLWKHLTAVTCRYGCS